MIWRRLGKWLGAALLLGCLLGFLPLAARSGPPAGKVDPLLLERLAADGQADLLIRFAEQADLSPAYGMDWRERGRFVVEALRQAAGRAQRRAIAYLDVRHLSHETYIAGNELYVHGGDLRTVQELAAWPEVQSIRLPRTFYVAPLLAPGVTAGDGLAWGLADTQADQFWATFHRQGRGIVVANIDTGVQWDHPALGPSFRCGNDPADPACWADPSHICGPGGACDNHGHGTHTMGTMVGDDDPSLEHQVGMAPDAQWIACKGCETDACSEGALIACADWILAPGGSPDDRPHIVNNSWGGAGCDEWYRSQVDAWRAAGIFPAFAAGNMSSCMGLGSPGDYQESFASAAHDASRAIAYFSSKGPSCYGHDPYTKPNLSAPGVSVCSAFPTDSWNCGYSGTSMASPHSAGAVALLWSCNPDLIGQIDQTFAVLQDSAAEPPAGACGAPDDGQGNYTYGYGYLDVLAAGLRVCGSVGWLAGHVADAEEGRPIVGALVTAQGERAYSARTDATGSYTLTLVAGTYAVTATVYGYRPGTAGGVVVVTDTVTMQDLALQPLPAYVVSGTVTEAGTGAPLAAQVRALGVPVPPASTDPATGFYSLTLAQGAYTLRVTAFGHGAVERAVVIDGHQTQDVVLGLLPCILLVDDDQDDPDVHAYYRDALDSLREHTYSTWDTAVRGNPGADDLQGYRIVAWYTGYPFSASFTAADEQVVAAYLDAGGNFFLSSEDYLWEMGLTPFGRDYLGIAGYVQDVEERDVIGNAGRPIGDGLGPFELTPPVGWTGSLWTDYVTGTLSPFRFQRSGMDNSTSYEGGAFKSAFFAWPVEGMADVADRAAVLAAVFTYLGGCGSTAVLGGEATHAYYGTPLAGVAVTATAGVTGTASHATTGPAGDYTLALPAGAYEIAAAKAGYATAVVTGVVVITGTNTLDLALAAPVAQVRPGSMRACVAPGGMVTLTLGIANPGAVPLALGIAEAPLPPAGRAVSRYDVPWVSESITQGVVPAGGALDVAVVFSARPPYDVVGERYIAILLVAHNDPLVAGDITVPMAMVVETECRHSVYLPVVPRGTAP